MSLLDKYREDYEGDEPRVRRAFRCVTGMCGLADCTKCGHPEGEPDDDEGGVGE